jgi:hypothetical protein
MQPSLPDKARPLKYSISSEGKRIVKFLTVLTKVHCQFLGLPWSDRLEAPFGITADKPPACKQTVSRNRSEQS